MAQATGLLMKYDPNFCFSLTVGATAIVANKIYKRHTDGTLVVGTANFDGPLFYPLTVEGVGYDVECALVGYCTIPVIASGAWTKDCALAAGASGTVKAADGNDRVIGRAFAACDDEAVGIMIPTAGESAVLGDSMIDEASRKMALVVAAKGRAAGMTRTTTFTPETPTTPKAGA